MTTNHHHQSMKPAFEWYQQDTEVDIIDPDGWRFGSIEQQRYEWYHSLITHLEYSRKKARCTTTSYGSFKHQQPFDPPNEILPGSRGGHCVLPIFNDTLSSGSSDSLSSSSLDKEEKLDQSITEKSCLCLPL